MTLLRQLFALTPRIVSRNFKRKGSAAAGPGLPPPSPVKNIGEYIEPKWVQAEHVPVTYRVSGHPPSRYVQRVATMFGTIMWTWILLGLFYEPDHITGHHPWPDSSKWTDKELGIPEDLDFSEMEADS